MMDKIDKDLVDKLQELNYNLIIDYKKCGLTDAEIVGRLLKVFGENV